MNSLRHKIHQVIYDTDTPQGKVFDIILIILIVLSVIMVMLDSISSLSLQFGKQFLIFEWVVTILFTIEYALRIICIKKPKHYILSPLGIVDLLALLPTYLSVFIPGSHYFGVVRFLRVLRIFRIFKLVQFIDEYTEMVEQLRSSVRKIFVFLFMVFVIVVIFGSVMYMIEPASAGFTDIPTSIYWAIVTLTTVGYGDISPVTPLGKTLAALIMMMGYGIIAVPAGLVSAELSKSGDNKKK